MDKKISLNRKSIKLKKNYFLNCPKIAKQGTGLKKVAVVTNISYVSGHMIRVKTGWQGLISFQKFKDALKPFVGRVLANL